MVKTLKNLLGNIILSQFFLLVVEDIQNCVSKRGVFMSVTIGNNNKIKNTIIADNCSNKEITDNQKSFLQKHPIICGIFIAVIAGFILTFSFWDKIRLFFEGLFK